MTVFLHGLALQFYRGIGSEMQRMYPFEKFNFFIGANNAGKSTILNFISDYFPLPSHRASTPKQQPNPLDQHRGSVSGTLSVEVAVPSTQFAKAIFNAVPAGRNIEGVRHLIDDVTEHLSENNAVWLQVGPSIGKKCELHSQYTTQSLTGVLGERDWYDLWMALMRRSGGSLMAHWIPETIQQFLNAQNLHLPDVRLIPALRQIGKKGSEFSDFSGSGLIDRLAQLQGPDHDKTEERLTFDKINAFLQDVVGRADAKIEIPYSREHVLVHMDNKVLPLASLGMGIHEVVMLATFCTLTNKCIVCIEEPEIHLHPVLQRKLVRYLNEQTENQYFIATHSASFIDTPGAAIFHVTNDGQQTRIRESNLRKDRHNICVDLGFKASDIVQANAVIWVEGPSDRIYLSHWISDRAPHLIEGIHYSIMFYGGRLLSHLSADAEELGAFIALRSLNQHLAVVIDSDKDGPRSHLNETKKRLLSELTESGGLCWVTKGREIENYIEHSVLQAAVKRAYPTSYLSPFGSGDPYEHALHFRRVSNGKRRAKSAASSDLNIERDVDKVRVARLVCETKPNLDVLDLKSKVTEIVNMIEAANA